MTPRFSKKLKAHINTGRLQVHTDTTVRSQRFDEACGAWTIETSPQVELPPFDHVYFATGAHVDAREVECLRTTNDKYPTETYGGLPALTDDLQWSPDVPLFLTGKLASLQIGPGAANLEGARLSAERIAWAIDAMLESGSDGAAEQRGSDEDHRHRYLAGIGSRYDQLGEE